MSGRASWLGRIVRGEWGWLPLLAVTASWGLTMFAVAYSLARTESSLAEPLFWLGFLVIGLPITLRVGAADVPTRERIGVLVVLGIALYIVPLLSSPLAFTGYDELQHFRSLTDIVSTGHLFENNPLLDVSPLFPALETVTASVVQVSGADPFTAAVVVLGAVRILFAGALYLLYREASSSERVAGLATAVYMLNPNFTFFDSQFAYESLAIPLAALVIVFTAIRARRTEEAHHLLSVALVVAAATLVVTHHVTSYETAALLAAWVVVRLVVRRSDRYRGPAIALAALLMIVGCATWLVNVAQLTIGYLGPPIAGAVQQFIHLITTGEGRTLFQSSTGQVAPIWERFAGLGMAGLLVLALGIGLVELLRHHRTSSLALLLGLVSLAYPASMIGRLTPNGSEAAGRSLAIIFLGLSFVVALAVTSLVDLAAESAADPTGRLRSAAARLSRGWWRVAWRAAFVASAVTLILGGVVVGSAPSARLPGPYLVSADSRSIDAEGIDAALWVRQDLGPQQRIAGDRVNRLLMGAYGDAHVVFHGSDGIEEWQPFLSVQVGAPEVARLQQGRVRYIVIDRRLSSGLPVFRYYYEEGEIFEAAHTEPVSAAVLAKWDSRIGVDRVFDSGNIQLYDVGGIDGAR